MANEKRWVGSLPNKVYRKPRRSRIRDKKQFQSLSIMALYDFSVLCLLTSKENKGIKKKIRKDKSHGNGRGLMKKAIFFQMNANWPRCFLLKKRVKVFS